jgi:hyaluronan synthase
MTAFLLQLWTLVQQGQVKIYFIFFLIINAFFWLRVYIGSKNKACTKKFTGKLAVIVPVFREDAEVFERCLSTIKQYGNPVQLIVTIDDVGHAEETIKKLAEKYATQVIGMEERVGKREQFYAASLQLKEDVDVVITVDSDTYWDDTTTSILSPFTDVTVGAASGRQTIFNYKKTSIRRIAEWFEDLRFSIVLPFQSYFGQVNVIPGRTLAIRASLFKEIAGDVREERVLGRRVITSDDASITMGVLERGYKSVYQSNSLVHTDAPDTLVRFLKQYLRWYRGSIRRFFYKFPVLIKQHPLVFLSTFEFIFGTFLYTAILSTFVFKLNFRLYEIVPISGFEFTESFNLWFISVLVLGYAVSSYMRNLPHLLRYKRDFMFLPVFALFTFIIMPPLKIVSLFTFFENGWMTRRHHTGSFCEERVLVTRVVSILTGISVVLITLPLPYLVDVYPTHIPLAAIVRNEGPEYYRAMQIIASYQEGDKPATDNQINHLIERYSIHHGLKLSAETQTAAVSCAKSGLTNKTGSSRTTPPLDLFAGCIDNPGRYFATAPQDKQHKTSPEANSSIRAIKVAPGDSLTKIVRASIRDLDTNHTLSKTQVVFVETTHVDKIGRDNHIEPGETVSIDLNELAQLIEQSKQLSGRQLHHWQPHGASIRY